jgi:uncharacterized membrane protein
VLLITFSVALTMFMAALTAAAFTRTPAASFAGYFEWIINVLVSLITATLAYFLGTRHARGHEDKS